MHKLASLVGKLVQIQFTLNCAQSPPPPPPQISSFQFTPAPPLPEMKKNFQFTTPMEILYSSGMINLKSFVGKVLLQIKWKFELNYTL